MKKLWHGQKQISNFYFRDDETMDISSSAAPADRGVKERRSYEYQWNWKLQLCKWV
jgi:hypothetical protein